MSHAHQDPSKDEDHQSVRSDGKEAGDNRSDDSQGRQSPEVDKDRDQEKDHIEQDAGRDDPDEHRDQSPRDQPQDDQRDRSYDEEESFMEVEAEPGDPKDFDSKSFLSSVSDLSVQLQEDNLKHVDDDFPAHELKKMVRSVTTTMNNFKNYAMHSQRELEAVREQMREIKERVYKRIQAKGYDPKSAHEKKGLEERELEAKVAQLNREVGKAAEELARASQLSVDTESAAVEASLVAEQAAEEARRIQEQYETRRKAEIEQREREEKRKAEQQKQREVEEKRQEEVRKAEEARLSKLRKHDDNKTPEWESWPTFTYKVAGNDYNQNVGCIIRGDPSHFRENMATIDVVDTRQVALPLGQNEELVSDIIDLRSSQGDDNLQTSIYVAMPHCTSRASAMTREPVLKVEVTEGKWEELRGQEVTFDGYKDLKFVQAEVKTFSKLCVITRFKRDFLHFAKKGGKVTSNVDTRVSFKAEKNSFSKTENFVLQLQPIDSATITRVKESAVEAKKLLTCSSIVNLAWTSETFDTPILMTLPCPPNPVKAKKAAAARAAKEAKMKNPQMPVMNFDGEDDMPKRKETKKRNTKQKQVTQDDDDDSNRPKTAVTKWYMGEYGNNEDDENDTLFFLKRMPNGRWHVQEHMVVLQVKLDLLQLQLREPLDTFMVLRTKTSADIKDAQCLAETIERCLNERLVGIILKQRQDSPTDVVLSVVPKSKVEKTVKSLEEEGYEQDVGNVSQPNKEVTICPLNEGDNLEISFRGNVKAASNHEALEFIFNSQIKSQICFSIQEVDKFLQKGFSDFRGFVQLVKKTTIVHPAPKNVKREEGEPEPEPRIEIKKAVMSEHLVRVPKEEEHSPRPLQKAPVVIRNEDHCLDTETLRRIAQSLRDEWSRVAYYLNIRKPRIQAILHSNTQGSDDEETKYQMLITWLKKVPRSQNKVDTLCNALAYNDRDDLVEDLRQTEKEFQAKRHGQSAKGKRSRQGSRASVRPGSARSGGEE